MNLFKKIGLVLAHAVPCHRHSDRCIHIKGNPMPICARCLAIYPMYLLLPLAFMFVESNPLHLYIGLGLAVPMLIDGFTQSWGWRTSNNFLRVTTGILFGLSQVILIAYIAQRFVVLL